MRQVKIFLLLFSLVMILTSCKEQRTVDNIDISDGKEPLRLMLPGEPSVLDPGMTSEIYAAPFAYHAFEPLVRLDREGKVVPAAASSWEISDDGLTVTFNLQEKGKWSDGEPVSSRQFKDAWLRILSPESKSPSAALINPYISGAEQYSNGVGNATDVGIMTPDDKTFIVSLKEPTPFFLEIVSYWAFAPIRKEVASFESTEWVKNPGTAVSNGPYLLTEYEPKKKMHLVKNPNYWNASSIHIEALEFLFKEGYEDPYAMYLQGELDGIYQVKAQEAKAMTGTETDIHVTQAMSTAFVLINHKNERLAHLELRNALGAAIDRVRLLDQVLLGAGTPSKYFIPSVVSVDGVRMRDPEKLDEPFDSERVKGLLKEVKSKNVDLDTPFRVFYMENGPDAEVIKAVVAQWEESLGFKFELKAMEWPDLYRSMVAGDYDIVMMGYTGDYPHPMNFLGLFTENGILSKLSGWKDPTYISEYYSILAVKDQSERLERMRHLEDIIVNDNHIIPLYHRKAICLMSTRVEGWYRNALSEFVFTEADLSR